MILADSIVAKQATTREVAKIVSGMENIYQSDGIGIALTGMLIVFTGLILISLFIALLPTIIFKLEHWLPVAEHSPSSNSPSSNSPSSTTSQAANAALEEEVVAAIGYTLHHHK